jgi:hypothetical protein
MKRALAILVLLAVPTLASAQRPDCIEVEAIARWGADAYNHFVVIENHCDRAARCRVSTNANPEVQTVEVRAGGRVELITFRGSPASEFTPNVACDLR